MLFVSGGSPVEYLRSFVREDPPSVQDISQEEFQRILKRTERRHGRHETPSGTTNREKENASPPAEMVVEPDTDVRRRWEDKFSASIRTYFDTMEVIPATPKFGHGAFSAHDLSGDTQSSTQYRGTWLLVNFWASWCVPCREEMPSLDRLNEAFPERLDVVAVNVGEDEESVRTFREDVNFEFTVWMDPDRSLTRKFGTRRLPETWIVNPEGQFVGVLQGPREWTREQSLKLFRALTSEQK
jgi:thiol-disulfide isomerase/thioredoxin